MSLFGKVRITMFYSFFNRGRAFRQRKTQRQRRVCSLSQARQLRHEGLEDRTLLAAIVSNAADAGDGTLRAAIEWVNENPGTDTIEFDASLAGMTITLTSGQLPITDNLTIIGLGADRLVISGNKSSRIFSVDDLAAMTQIAVSISGLTLVNGQNLYGNGGAVYNGEDLAVINCVLAGNRAAGGGGIFNVGTLAVTGSTLANNFAGDGGGGISGNGTLTVTNSTLAGNSAGFGGGILNAGTLTVINSTLANNSAKSNYGGGILNVGDLIAANTLAGGNTATHGPDVLNFGKIAAANHNVIQDGSDSGIADGVDGNQVGVAVLLDPAGLQDHGGPTPTIALLPGSPALNAGNSELAVDATGAPLEFDQRGFGFPRFVGASVDVGAWEALNRPPVANDDAATTAEDTAIGIAVLDNDSDPDGDALIVVLPGGESGPRHGTVIAREDGSLTYTPEPDYFGPDTFTYQTCDPGGLCDTAIVAITVLPVNDPPTFHPGNDQVVDEDAGPRTVTNWATNISPGPLNEAGQSVWFAVTNDNQGLFSRQPSVAPDGTLIYTPAPNAYGGAIVTVVLRDDGGRENGGVDASETQTFLIIVNPVIDGLIDVKPGNGDEIDPINLDAKGFLPMVIYSGGIDNFDATRVDVGSIRLNGKHIDPRQVAFEDVDGDGDADLVLHFAVSEIRNRGVFDPNIVDVQILTLTAEIDRGEALGPDLFAGDWMRLVPAPG
jgi:hypothetical protein